MIYTSHSLSRIAITTALAAASSGLIAQNFDTVRLQAAAAGQDGGYIGAAVIAGTQYRGSDERRTLVLPTAEYQWANGWFVGTGNGLGFNFSSDPSLQYGARLTLDLGRDESRSTALNGMGDLAAKAEFGGFFNLALTPGVMLNSSVRTGSGDDSNGTLLDLGIAYSTTLGQQWRVSAGAELTWANDAYMQSCFGVSTEQSNTSGYAVYTPGAALRDARLRMTLSYQFDPRVRMTAALTWSALSDEAKRSPLVRSADTTSAVFALTYAF